MKSKELLRIIRDAFGDVPFPYKKSDISPEAYVDLNILQVALDQSAKYELKKINKQSMISFWEDFDDLLTLPENEVLYVLPRLMALTLHRGTHDVFDIRRIVDFLNLSGYTATVAYTDVKQSHGALVASQIAQDRQTVAEWYRKSFPPLNQRQIQALLHWLDFISDHPELADRKDEIRAVTAFWRKRQTA